jgi:hypothetical protein
MKSFSARKCELCRSGKDDFALGFVFTDSLVVTGLRPGAWPASPKSNSAQLLVDASMDVVAANGISSTFAS